MIIINYHWKSVDLSGLMKVFSLFVPKRCGPGSSVGIATGYELDGPGIESQWGTRFSEPVQTGPGAHPASCIMVKAVPLQAWRVPEGSRKLRFPDFMTTAQEVGKVVSLTHRPHLPPGNHPGTHFC